MLTVTTTEKALVFSDAKGRVEQQPLFAAMENKAIVNALKAENKAAHNAQQAAISALVVMLDNPRLDGWKGKTPANEAIPVELKAAIREIESDFHKPLFMASLPAGLVKSKPGEAEQLWQEYAGRLKAGGSYAVAKSEVTKLFAITGRLPKADNGLLMNVAAIKKLLQNAKEGAAKPEKEGIAGQLVKLSLELQKRNEKTIVGNSATAIAALKAMLAVYEQFQTDADQTATQAATGPSVTQQAAEAVKKAGKAPEPALL